MDLASMLGIGQPGATDPTLQQDPSGRGPVTQQAVAPGGEQAPQSGGWNSFLSSPQNRAFLMSAGLQMMTGGWGNAGQQLGAALGHGAEAASGVTAQQQAQAAEDKKLAQSETNTRISADSRNEVAQIRSEAMLQRAALIHGPQNNQEMKIYSDAANKYRGQEMQNQLLTKKTTDQINQEADAWGKSVLRNARESAGVRSQGAALPGDATGASSGVSPEGGGPVQTGAPQKGAEATSKSPGTVTLSKLMADPKNGPRVRELLATPEGQSQILQANPGLKQQIDAYNYSRQHGSIAPYVPPDIMNSGQTP